MKDKEKQIKFSVIDNKTGEYPDLYKIALKEEWAKGLMYCDMEGFSINEDGQLILSDECGNFVYCPSDRFTVVFENSVVILKEDKATLVHIDTLKNIQSISQLKELFSNITAINDLMGYNDRELEIRQEERKETAEKFYDKVMSFIGSNQKFWIVDEEHITIIQVDKLFDFVMETAKQLGVEIKE